MLTVACVLRSGGDFNADDVAKLRNGFYRHLKTPFRFVCLSDVDVPCERIPLQHGWPGWWSKIELFRLRGPILYADLDTVLVGDLDEIASRSEQSELTALWPFYRKSGLASGFMAWGGDHEAIYREFAESPGVWMDEIGRRGDQGFMECVIAPSALRFWQRELPGQVVSYKVNVRDRGLPAGARVVCFHGKPRPRDVDEIWVRENQI